LKFFSTKILYLKIYDYYIKCKDSTFFYQQEKKYEPLQGWSNPFTKITPFERDTLKPYQKLPTQNQQGQLKQNTTKPTYSKNQEALDHKQTSHRIRKRKTSRGNSSCNPGPNL